jgi:surfeit locus 1 family protein
MRLPILSIIIVGAAAAVMIGFGFWQLERASWKAGVISELRAARDLPPVNLDTMPNDRARSYAFRRARVTCSGEGLEPQPRAGRGRDGATGYRYLVPCRERGDLLVDIGFSPRPDLLPQAALHGLYEGTLSAGSDDFPIFLTLDTPLPPLAPSALSSPDEIPDNHLIYALQWFFFAAAAVVIYVLALRRRRRIR